MTKILFWEKFSSLEKKIQKAVCKNIIEKKSEKKQRCKCHNLKVKENKGQNQFPSAKNKIKLRFKLVNQFNNQMVKSADGNVEFPKKTTSKIPKQSGNYKTSMRLSIKNIRAETFSHIILNKINRLDHFAMKIFTVIIFTKRKKMRFFWGEKEIRVQFLRFFLFFYFWIVFESLKIRFLVASYQNLQLLFPFADFRVV